MIYADRSINIQELKRFEIDAVTIKKFMTDYLHLINSQAYICVLTQHSMGGNEYGKSGHVSIFNLLMHLMMLLKYKFSRD